MKSFFRNNAQVLLVYLAFVLTALFFILSYNKTAIHIYMNDYVGNPLANIFFYYITYLGDGAAAAFILLLIIFYNVRTGLYATASFLSASLFSILLKNVFFDDVNRPWFIFHWVEKYPIKLVEGVDLHIHNSFPSGHATQAFGIFMCLVFVAKPKGMKFLFFALAAVTALSRVYLSQHWLADITAGSVIGTAFSILYYYLFISKNRWQQLDRPLTEIKKKRAQQ